MIDEAQHLSDIFLLDLGGFLNFAFDSRDLFTLWLVGLPPLTRRLRMLQHAALYTRVATEVRLEPLDREAFALALDHGFKAAGATCTCIASLGNELSSLAEQLIEFSKADPTIVLSDVGALAEIEESRSPLVF